jgi:hypothetical protein
LAKPQFPVVTVARSPASCRSPCASSIGSCLPRSLDSTAPSGMEEAASELAEVGRRRSRCRAHRGGEETAGSSSSVAASRRRPGGRRPQGIVQLIHINSNLCYEKKKKKKVEKKHSPSVIGPILDIYQVFVECRAPDTAFTSIYSSIGQNTSPQIHPIRQQARLAPPSLVSLLPFSSLPPAGYRLGVSAATGAPASSGVATCASAASPLAAGPGDGGGGLES